MTIEETIKTIQKPDWFVQSAPGLPLFFTTTGNVPGWRVAEEIGAGYRHLLYFLSGDRQVWMHYDKADLANVADVYYERIHDIADLKALITASAERYQRAVRAEKAARTPRTDLTGALERIHACRARQEAACAHMIEGVGFGSEQRLRTALEKRSAAGTELVSILSAPEKPSFVADALQLLWKINTSTGTERDTRVREYLERYCWIENSYVGSVHLAADDVVERAARLSEKPAIPDFKSMRTEKERVMNELSFDVHERFVVVTISMLSTWQDDRKIRILESIEAYDAAVEPLANAVDIEPSLFKCLLPEELSLERLQEPGLADELTVRAAGTAFYCTPTGSSIFTGADFRRMADALDEPVDEAQTELAGMVAGKGKVCGKVRVCRSLADIAAVKSGDILVASMTRPDYLTVMQKAAAFVTDEGGITCHAAIIAREMKKPCVIGTQVATKVLKDGDLVEVDAEKGVVKILKRSSEHR